MDAQRAVACRSGGPNVASLQNGSRWARKGEHQVAADITYRDLSQLVPRVSLLRTSAWSPR